MTYADDQRRQIQAVLQNLLSATGDGAAAVGDATDAMGALSTARHHLEGSRVYALQELGKLQDTIADLNRLFPPGDRASDVSDAISFFTRAMELVEAYANHINQQINDIDALIPVINQNRIDDEISASGRLFAHGTVILQRYMGRI